MTKYLVEIQYTAVTSIEIETEDTLGDLIGEDAVQQFTDDFPSDQVLFVADYGNVIPVEVVEPAPKAGKK